MNRVYCLSVYCRHANIQDTHVKTHAHTHARAHTHTRTYTHKNARNNYINTKLIWTHTNTCMHRNTSLLIQNKTCMYRHIILTNLKKSNDDHLGYSCHKLVLLKQNHGL
jgi:hypothetical protein